MARRNRNRRRRGGGHFAFLYKLLTFFVICGVLVAALSLFFKIDQTEVTGAERYSAQQVVQASGIQLGQNLYLLDKYEIAANIADALPYVESVRISRKLPNTLCFEVTECTQQVQIQQSGTVWQLCHSGKIVDTAISLQEGAVITGLTLENPAAGRMLQVSAEQEKGRGELLVLLQRLEEKGMLADCQEIHLEDPDLITLRFREHFRVELLWGSDLNYELNYLLAVLEKLEVGEKGTIDLTPVGKARFIPA